MRVRISLAVVLAVAAAVPVAADARTRARGLRAFHDCPELVSYARANGSKSVATGWVPGAPVGAPMPVNPAPQEVSAQGKDNAGAAPVSAGTQFSTTNVQEEGVDEPDTVKTDGKTLFAVSNGHLYAIDVRSATPKLLGSLTLAEGSGHELLLHGDKLLVLQNAWLPGEGTPPGPPSEKIAADIYPIDGRSVTRLTEIDVSDPAAMKVLRNERADGSYVSARVTGKTARVVVVSRPEVIYDVVAVSAPTETTAIRRRKQLVRRARLASWRPASFFRRSGTANGRLHPLVACRSVRHPVRFSGLDTVTILTVDLDRGLPSVDSDAVMGDADIVYGSPNRLYVATQRWLAPQILERPEPPPITTQIHAFDVSKADATSYSGSGTVTGFLLNQFSLSEERGVLRVASTENPTWWNGERSGGQSFVTTLDATAATLPQLGRIGELGKGQRIYAVRFIGDTGYVVTFRQIDPLYTIDLSKPAQPRVLGELEIAGYSAYLHPLEGKLLLGVGQDAGEDGRTRGTQLSLFDVSDPAKPTRLASRAVGESSSSSVEYDHKAFLYWAPEKLAVIPVQVYGGEGQQFTGAIGFRVSRSAIDEAGRVSHPETNGFLPTVQRSVVVDDELLTVSDGGLLASNLHTLAGGPWLPFPFAPDGGPRPLPAQSGPEG